MTRRKAKKTFKKKWNAPGRIAWFKTVPNKWSPRTADRFNTHVEAEIKNAIFKAMDEAILYVTGGKANFYEPQPVGILGRPLVARLVDNGVLPAAVGEIVFDASAGGASLFPAGEQIGVPGEQIGVPGEQIGVPGDIVPQAEG